MSAASQAIRQAVVVSQAEIDPTRVPELLALFDETGLPAQAITFEDVPTGADVLLTGYSIGSVTDVDAADTVNEAIGKVEAKADAAATPVASAVILTGFVTGSDVTDISATDNVAEALAKLQNRIAALEP